MPIVGIGLSTIIAIFFAIHCVKNNQDRYWLYILFIFPYLGSLVYFFAIFLPQFRNTYTGYQIESKVRQVLDPARELRQAQENHEIAPTIDSKINLANALLNNNQAKEALTYYQQVLSNDFYKTAPDILLQYAYALYAGKQFAKAKETLKYLRATNPNYRSDNGHLLYTKILVSLNQQDQAEEEFESLMSYNPSLEVTAYYLQTLIHWDQIDNAKKLLQETEQRVKHMPKYAKRINSQWLKEIEQVKQKLNQL